MSFTITITDREGENGQSYRIHSFDDAMVQVRLFQKEQLGYVIGTRGMKKIEHTVQGDECIKEAVDFVCKELASED